MCKYLGSLADVDNIVDSFKGNTTLTDLAKKLKLEILRDWVKTEELGPDLTVAEHDALRRNRDKILAIKLYRQRTNCGLKEAKDYIESKMLEHGYGRREGSCITFN